MPARPGLGFFDEFAEAQHDAALARIDDVKAARQPHRDHQTGQNAGAAAELRDAGAAAGRAAVALPPPLRPNSAPIFWLKLRISSSRSGGP